MAATPSSAVRKRAPPSPSRPQTTGGASPRKTSKSPSSSSKSGRKTPSKSDWFSDEILFSPNPDKAWAEKFFLAYSLVWPVLFGGLAVSGLHLHIADSGNLLASILIAAPNLIVPYYYCPTNDGRPFYELFWFKYMVWLFIFTFVATYFWTEYFFDVLGMKYAFTHLSWNLDSVLVGTDKQRVPLIMLVSSIRKSTR